MPRGAQAPASIGDQAAENLRVIRRTLERSGTFTAVPGAGGAAMGVVGLAAAAVGAVQSTPDRWLAAWLGAALVATAVGLVTMTRKAARHGAPLSGAVGRKFGLALAAPLVAGSAVTYGLWSMGDYGLMPSVWLLLYGTGVLTGGGFSIAVVRVMGVVVMGLGLVAVVTPPAWGNVWLALGFGVAHVGFGLHIARQHGG